MTVRALRGATTIDHDETAHLTDRVRELVQAMLEDNDLTPDDFISVIVTATPDIKSVFPAKAIRDQGFDDIPLLGAQELDVDGAMPLCIRLLAHIETDKARSELRHCFQYGAQALRPDMQQSRS